MSVGYYTRLERGEVRGASDSVLEAVARALQLTDIEREHLFRLARTGSTTSGSAGEGSPVEVGVSLRHLVDSIGVPAIVQTPRLDLVARSEPPNHLGTARPPHSRSDKQGEMHEDRRHRRIRPHRHVPRPAPRARRPPGGEPDAFMTHPLRGSPGVGAGRPRRRRP
ncbi:helix-turn-helix domain-containing protein [Tessaracoccus sp.]|uniref:helix-turn-helix domain-containing protein n=1 Tax=Tessaracoccus sp. TaxID=1971211 RepID=UPI00262698CC|nr:helix-turn-helix transcriptional regulator [Tessaracoccus sp.]